MKLQQALVGKPSVTGLKPWVVAMIKDMVSPASDGAAPTVAADARWPVFLDFIWPGEQGRINGKEPGRALVGLTVLRRM